MVLIRIKAMDMQSESIYFLFRFFTWKCKVPLSWVICLYFILFTGNLCTNLRLIEVSGSHPDKEHQDHPLDLDQGLLNCHLDVEDEVKFDIKVLFIRISVPPLFWICSDGFYLQVALEVCWQCATCVMYISFNLPEYLFIKTCRLLKSLCITMDECIIFKLIYWRGAFWTSELLCGKSLTRMMGFLRMYFYFSFVLGVHYRLCYCFRN